MPTLDEAVTQFLARPKRGAIAAANTETREVQKFAGALGRTRAVEAILPGQVEDYVKRFMPGWNEDTDMARALRSNPAAQTHLRAVQGFLRWLRRQGWTATDLATVIKLPAKATASAPDKNLYLD